MKQITSVEQIFKLAHQGKAVFWTARNKPIPAAFLQNWPANRLYGIVARGTMFFYEPPKGTKAEMLHATGFSIAGIGPQVGDKCDKCNKDNAQLYINEYRPCEYACYCFQCVKQLYAGMQAKERK